MELKVNVNVELGAKTLEFLTGIPNIVLNGDKKDKLSEAIEAPEKKEAPKRTAKPKEAPKKEPEEASKDQSFEELDGETKLESLKAEVVKHTEKGKSADIKSLLSSFDAGRASELAPEDYNAFYEAISRYGKGESIENILGNE